MKKLLVVFGAIAMLFSGISNKAAAYEVETLSRDGKMQELVSSVGFRLLDASRIDKIIPIYYDPHRKDVNAHADIHKRVVIHKGLMRFIESEDELAAIIGHEITHAIDFHKGPFAYIPMNLNPKSYEFKADKKAIDLMVNAGYNPVALIVVSVKFMHQSYFDWVPLICSHPKTSRRLASMYDYIYMKYPQYLANNAYKDNIYYQNFLLTSKENRKRFEAKVKDPGKSVRYK